MKEWLLVFCAIFLWGCVSNFPAPSNPDAQNWNIECVFQLRIHRSGIFLDLPGAPGFNWQIIKVYVDFQSLKMFHWKILGGDEPASWVVWEVDSKVFFMQTKKNPTSGKQICDWWLSRPGFVGNIRALDVAVLFLVDGRDATFPQLWQLFKKRNQKSGFWSWSFPFKWPHFFSKPKKAAVFFFFSGKKLVRLIPSHLFSKLRFLGLEKANPSRFVLISRVAWLKMDPPVGCWTHQLDVFSWRW